MAAGLKAVLKESIGHTLLSISPLGTKVIGWTSRTKGSVKRVQGHPLLSISPLGTKEMGWTSVTWVYLPVKVQVSVQQLYISTTRTP